MKYSCIALIILILQVLAFASCDRNTMSGDVISQNDAYVVTGDSVVEGQYSAVVVSPTCIKSNYAPADTAQPSGIVKFRLAFNGHDNEMSSCYYHYARVSDDTTTVAVGVPDSVPAPARVRPLLQDHDWVLRVDLRRVQQALNDHGHYVTATGDTIYADEFKGVWVAGNVAPMTWNFITLAQQRQLRLHETSTPGIYEVKLHLQPQSQPVTYNAVWKIDRPNPDFAVINTGVNLVDALYNMSIQDIVNYRQKSGAQGYQVNQDYGANPCYAIILSLAYLDPQVSMQALRAMVGGDGAIDHASEMYPIIANDLSWAVAAWEVYTVTGSKAWLNYAFNVIKKTIDADMAMNADQYSGLLHGGLRFAYSQSQFYPSWMQPKDIYETQSLTVNLLYERALEILSDMGDELGNENDYGEKALALKEGINETLWSERHGYYSQYIAVEAYPVQSPGIDNLGQSLSVLWNVADDDRAVNLVKKTPITNYGVPTASPRYEGLDELNLSQTVTPVIQAFWNLAAAKTGNEHMLRRGLGALYRAAALFGANRLAWNAYTGQALNSVDGDLGAATANAAMVFRIYAGMTFLPGGIEFNPVIPTFMPGTKHFYGFKYRKASLDITIEGTGDDIESISIDGKVGHDNFFDGQLTGHHTILIKMRTSSKADQEVTLGDQNFSLPPTPVVRWNADSLRILNYDPDIDYRMVVNGQLQYSVGDSVALRRDTASVFTVSSIVGAGRYALSYISRPTYRLPQCQIVGLGDANKGYITVGGGSNTAIELHATVPAGGDYCIDLRYANGGQPQSCPTYVLSANGHPQGTIVMPALGVGEWLRKGWSCMITAELLKGDNKIELKRVDGSGDMALLFFVRIIKK